VCVSHDGSPAFLFLDEGRCARSTLSNPEAICGHSQHPLASKVAPAGGFSMAAAAPLACAYSNDTHNRRPGVEYETLTLLLAKVAQDRIHQTLLPTKALPFHRAHGGRGEQCAARYS
jgi:hypothetical protein